MGIVEGLTEFLPISSTFHLLMAAKVLGIEQTEFAKFFEVFIQAGAIIPLLVMFWQELVKDRKLLVKIGAGFLPAAVIGLLLHKLIKTVFFATDWLMIAMFIGVGLLFVLIEWLVKQRKLVCEQSIHQLTIPAALKTGLFQALAVIPGVSRSGSTMMGGMLVGLTRSAAAKFSFLLAVPTILAASALDLFQSREMVLQLTTVEWQALMVGFITSLVVGWLSIHWLLTFVKKHSMAWFGWYRVVAGIALAIALLVG